MIRRGEARITQQRIHDQAAFVDTQPFYIPGDVCEISELAEKEAQAILDSTEIHGDPVKENIKKEDVLTVDKLRVSGLEPKYMAHIGEASIAFSRKYEGIGRVATVAYVNDGDHHVARTFYLSNSHGVWKYLPNYSAYYDETEEHGLHYGKGFGENSIDLPLVAQKEIFEFGNDDAVALDENSARLTFLGTTRRSSLHSKDTYSFSTLSNPMRIEGNFYPPKPRRNNFVKIPPEELVFTDKQCAPNFADERKKWKASTNIYGQVDFTLFGSHDNNLVYLFCRDKKNRAWVGGLENGSPIQSTGVRMQWMDGGDLLTPAYEYIEQSGKFGNFNDHPEGNDYYIDMFENYLSKVPIIQEYLQSLKK